MAETKPNEGDTIVVTKAEMATLLARMDSMEKELASTASLDEVKAIESGTADIREIENIEEKWKKAPKVMHLRSVAMEDPKTKQVVNKVVVGWTKRGCYVKVKDHPNEPETLMYDVYFYGDKEPVAITAKKFLDSPRIKCMEIGRDITVKKYKTGEELEVTEFDPKHGLKSTGTIIDGYYATPEGTYALKVPGINEPVVVNINHVNA